MKDLDLDNDSLPMERALGGQWCVQSDLFKFNIMLRDRPLTRRGILSTVSSVYDPLGFLAQWYSLPKGSFKACVDNSLDGMTLCQLVLLMSGRSGWRSCISWRVLRSEGA